MKIRVIGANQTELEIKGGDVVLFSYNTPVAIRSTAGAFKTDQRWSNTTQRHINKWGGKDWPTKPQEWFDGLEEIL
jgi:hypothetical protein